MTAYVYRLLDATGACLYVGATENVAVRVRNHRRRSWGDQIATVEASEHADRGTAEQIETEEIRRLRPVHNVIGTFNRPCLSPGRLQDIVYGFVVDRGPIDQRDLQRLLNDTGYTGHTDSAVGGTLRRLLDRGVLSVAGARPAIRGRYRNARLYAASPSQQRFYLAWYGDWRDDPSGTADLAAELEGAG